MMKILHITNVYAPAGGIETYILGLLPLLEERGHENTLIYRKTHPKTPATDGRHIYHVPVEPNHNQTRIIELIHHERPTVIYLHDVYDPLLIQQIAQIAPAVSYVHIFYPVCPGLGKLYRRGDQVCTRPFGFGCIPTIYLRDCSTARHPRSVYRIMQNTQQYLIGYRSLPRVIIASEYMRELMVQNGIEAKRLEVLPYFIPIPGVSEISAPDANCRDIMFAGRLEYEKGLPYLLQALRLIPERHQLLVAGDGSLKQEYIRLAESLGVADRVQFVGWLSARELDAAYRRCAVTVMPTIMPEPFGKVGVEAMSNGRPVVAFDVGGIPDWLKDGYNGFLVPPRDVKQLAYQLNQILSDTNLTVQLGANGRKYVEDHYSPTLHVDRLVHILETVINSG